MRSLNRRRVSGLITAVVTASLLAASWTTAGSAGAATVTVSKLKLLNGWTDQASGTAKASAVLDGSIVKLGGGLQTSGTNSELFILPSTMRPPTDVYVNVGLCNGTHGALNIAPTGEVDVDADPFTNAQCFVSLDGVTFGVHAGGFHALTLLNGWTTSTLSPTAPAATVVNGVVTLRGAAENGSTTTILKLPAAMRPSHSVRVPVALCNATTGRLTIDTDGSVTVTPQNGHPFSEAQCRTSLDGASFVQSPVGAASLTLINGWADEPFSSGPAAIEDESGYIHLSGAIVNGTNMFPFVLPPGFRPSKATYVPVDLCNETNGRLVLLPDGAVQIQPEGNVGANATCFTSLDGVSYEANAYTKLKLINGWQSPPVADGFNTSSPSVAVANGIVTLAGAMKTAGSNPLAFRLPPGFRPTTAVYVPITVCNAREGRLFIASNGDVTVQTPEGDFGQAQCFTSLDGVSFSIMPATFHALTLVNGWVNAPFGTNNAAVSTINGVVTFKGAVSGGSAATLFTLPAAYRPSTDVYVKVDLCDSGAGSLHIQPSGTVQVVAQNAFADAQCLTSLDGASFVRDAKLQTPLQLEGTWTPGPISTAPPAVEDLAGQVHLSGTVANGTDVVAFIVPPEFAPGATVYLTLTSCNGVGGALLIHADGNAYLNDLAPGCLTSLDGVTYAR